MYHIDNILVGLIFVLLHFLLFFLNYKLMKKIILHPAVLFSLIWFVILSAHFIFSFTLLNELPPLNISTYLIFFGGVLAFTFGGFIETVIWQKNKGLKNDLDQNIRNSKNEISLLLKCILLGIVLVGLPFFLQASYKIFLASNLDNFLIGLRSELVYGDEDIGILKYLFAFSLVTYAFILQSYLKESNLTNRLLLIISFLATTVYAVFTTGRLLFLLILVVYLGMRLMHHRPFSSKKIFGFIILFMITFILLGIVYNKGGNTEETAAENIKPAAQGTAIYMVASLNALDYELHNQFHIDYNGHNSLRFFMKLGETLNILPNAKVNDLIPPFVLVPYPTNVYTFYSPYIKDFGKFYAWFIISLLGFTQTYLYNKAFEKRNFRVSIWNSLMLFPLLVSFFADQYFSLISFWIQFAVCIEGIIFLNKFFTNKKWWI